MSTTKFLVFIPSPIYPRYVLYTFDPKVCLTNNHCCMQDSHTFVAFYHLSTLRNLHNSKTFIIIIIIIIITVYIYLTLFFLSLRGSKI